ncbi:hypothetical protein J6590_057790 [Homalodisca vitripennis]|nr:hypothetical protein J6590_057790 [Homalodisca vitripennis]
MKFSAVSANVGAMRTEQTRPPLSGATPRLVPSPGYSYRSHGRKQETIMLLRPSILNDLSCAIFNSDPKSDILHRSAFGNCTLWRILMSAKEESTRSDKMTKKAYSQIGFEPKQDLSCAIFNSDPKSDILHRSAFGNCTLWRILMKQNKGRVDKTR